MDTERIVAALGVREGMHVAELGCGTGYFALSLARVVGKSGVVSAVDIMKEPLESLQARAEAAGFGNVTLVRADLEVLGGTKIPDNSQDLALLANTLFQSQKKDAMIREGVRMLKPGGRLLFIEWKKGPSPFGPPDAMRVSEDALRHLAEAEGLHDAQPFDAGQFHYGLIYRK